MFLMKTVKNSNPLPPFKIYIKKKNYFSYISLPSPLTYDSKNNDLNLRPTPPPPK